eukprot:tig00000405_g440.t1
MSLATRAKALFEFRAPLLAEVFQGRSRATGRGSESCPPVLFLKVPGQLRLLQRIQLRQQRRQLFFELQRAKVEQAVGRRRRHHIVRSSSSTSASLSFAIFTA